MQVETYEKIEILKDLALDLWDTESVALCNTSLDLLLNLEHKNQKHEDKANRRALLEARAELYRKESHKARLVDKKYLSTGELELTFLDVNGDTFTKLYGEDSYEYQRNKKREAQHAQAGAEVITKKEVFNSFFAQAS